MQYFVSTTGSDANPGTQASPFLTIQKGVDVAAGGGVDTVFVAPGTYTQMVILWKAVNLISTTPGGAVIDSAMTIAGWSNVGGEVYQATYTDAAYPVTSNSGVNADIATYPGVYNNSSSPDGFNDVKSILHVEDVDSGNTANSWLRARNNGATLNRGEFYTTQTGTASPGNTHQVRVRLADGGNPGSHTVKMARYDGTFFIHGNPAGAMVVDGFKMQHAGFHNAHGAKSDITWRNCEFRWYKGFGIGQDFHDTNVTIENCWFHHFEYEAWHCQADNSRIRDCLIEETIAPWSIYGAVGVNLSGADDCVVERCTIRGMAKSVGGTSGTGIQNEDWYRDGAIHGNRNLFQRNLIYDCDGVGIAGGANDIRIYNNLVRDCGSHGIRAENGSGGGSNPNAATGWIIYHNTCVHNGMIETWGAGVSIDSGCSATVRNNIFHDNLHGQTDFGGTVTQNNNYTSTTPGFVNYGARDLRLATGSACINAGATGLGITVDYLGFARTGTPDQGAYEFGGTPPVGAPTIASLTPSTGPTSGGTSVAIVGTNFTGATGVTFGGVPGTGLTVNSATSITVTSPPGAAGTAGVIVTAPGGTSSAATYTYTAGPVGLLVVDTPLALNKAHTKTGDVISGTVIYRNDGAAPIAYNDIIVAGRPPGGTNGGGPYEDFAPVAGAGSLAPGATITVTATRTMVGGDAEGTWYAFATWHDGGGAPHDAVAGQDRTWINDKTAPTISAVASSTPSTTTATVTWTTSEAADSQVDYGLTGSYGSSSTLADTPVPASGVTAHVVGLAGLGANTLYHYRVKSRDAAGNLTTGGDNTFSTPATPPPTGPVPTALSPSSLPAGSPGFTLIVTGSGFGPASVVRWNNSSRTTTYISPTELRAAILAGDVATFGTAEVTVL